MPKRKSELNLPSRTPTYVDRQTGAAELCISVDIWDELTEEGGLVGPPDFYIRNRPRWSWSRIMAKLEGKHRSEAAPQEEPFFRIPVNVKAPYRRRKAA
jgi:hypothetical protein